MTAFVTRFAPSPTGRLHLGHAFSALTAYEAARKTGGEFLLRIEDIDRTRCTRAFENAILEDLAWLGVVWRTLPRRQSEHFAAYAEALEALRARGLVYRCFKTRKEVMAQIAAAPHKAGEGPEGQVYLGPIEPLDPEEEARRILAGDPFAWRLSLGAARAALGPAWNDLVFHETGRGPYGERGPIPVDPGVFGDVIIARKDLGTSYHLASVWDDALQGVTHVIRGEDLFFAAHLHVLLQTLLGLPQPVYCHHRLITDEAGTRLAKRDNAKTLQALREEGVTPGQIRDLLGTLDDAGPRASAPT